KMSAPRGRRAQSERLLARLGVLRCATCGARMVVGNTRQRGKQYAFYRCNPTSDCPHRVTISADLAERTVVDAVREILQGVHGTATVDNAANEAAQAFESAENELNAAIEAFTGLEDIAVAKEKLRTLREASDEARDRYEELQEAITPAITISADDWDVLTVEE